MKIPNSMILNPVFKGLNDSTLEYRLNYLISFIYYSVIQLPILILPFKNNLKYPSAKIRTLLLLLLLIFVNHYIIKAEGIRENSKVIERKQ